MKVTILRSGTKDTVLKTLVETKKSTEMVNHKQISNTITEEITIPLGKKVMISLD